jgi:hypothetical protein
MNGRRPWKRFEIVKGWAEISREPDQAVAARLKCITNGANNTIQGVEGKKEGLSHSRSVVVEKKKLVAVRAEDGRRMRLGERVGICAGVGTPPIIETAATSLAQNQIRLAMHSTEGCYWLGTRY